MRLIVLENADPAAKYDRSVLLACGNGRNVIRGNIINGDVNVPVRDRVMFPKTAIVGIQSSECADLYDISSTDNCELTVSGLTDWRDAVKKFCVPRDDVFDSIYMQFAFVNRAVDGVAEVVVHRGMKPVVPVFVLRNFGPGMTHVSDGVDMVFRRDGSLSDYGRELLDSWVSFGNNTLLKMAQSVEADVAHNRNIQEAYDARVNAARSRKPAAKKKSTSKKRRKSSAI